MQILASEADKSEGIADGDEHVCDQCKSRPAEIFQVSGDFCLECWQAITHTNA